VARHHDRDSHVGRVHPQIGDERLAEAAHGEFRGAVGSVGRLGPTDAKMPLMLLVLTMWPSSAAINIPGTFSCQVDAAQSMANVRSHAARSSSTKLPPATPRC